MDKNHFQVILRQWKITQGKPNLHNFFLKILIASDMCHDSILSCLGIMPRSELQDDRLSIWWCDGYAQSTSCYKFKGKEGTNSIYLNLIFNLLHFIYLLYVCTPACVKSQNNLQMLVISFRHVSPQALNLSPFKAWGQAPHPVSHLPSPISKSKCKSVGDCEKMLWSSYSLSTSQDLVRISIKTQL